MFASDKKRALIKEEIAAACGHTSTITCDKCIKKLMFIDLMADANIPSKYWFLKFADFKGAPNIKTTVEKYVENLNSNFLQGQSLCFVGTYGTGKTYSIAYLLKMAMINNFTAYYTSLTDVVNYSLDFSWRDIYFNKVMKSDFLAIDEVDSRHISSSEEAQKLFGSSFEKIIRYRTQNALPTLIATNNSSLDEVFTGQYKRVVESLSSSMTVVAALGKDIRLQN